MRSIFASAGEGSEERPPFVSNMKQCPGRGKLRRKGKTGWLAGFLDRKRGFSHAGPRRQFGYKSAGVSAKERQEDLEPQIWNLLPATISGYGA